jgi:hypothetical protein
MQKSSYMVPYGPPSMNSPNLDDFAREIVSRSGAWSRKGIQGHPIAWVYGDSMCPD